MAALCSVSEHCESDVRDKLQRASLSDADSDKIVERLYEQSYLDTARYCRAYVLDKMRFNQWGRIKIQQALRAKGLPEADIRQALQEIPQDEYLQVLRHVLAQKARTIHDDDLYLRKQKLMRFAVGRGFVLQEVMDELEAMEDE